MEKSWNCVFEFLWEPVTSINTYHAGYFMYYMHIFSSRGNNSVHPHWLASSGFNCFQIYINQGLVLVELTSHLNIDMTEENHDLAQFT